MPACVDLSVVGKHQNGIQCQVQVRNDFAQKVIGAGGGLVPAGVTGSAFVMSGVVHLVNVDQDKLVVAAIEPGQGRVHHGAVGGVIFTGCVNWRPRPPAGSTPETS